MGELARPRATGECVRSFAVMPTKAHALVSEIHDRAGDPAARRLRPLVGPDADPRELPKPLPAVSMTWPVSTRVKTPKNDDPNLLVPFVGARMLQRTGIAPDVPGSAQRACN
jgi:putative SOS response-associated peptidase YedK